jgi:predicted RNA-binding Zn-ribbon protein involved in translation (DUF1610 family)
MADHDKFDCRDCGPHITRIVALPEGHSWCDRCTACNQRLASRRRAARHCRPSRRPTFMRARGAANDLCCRPRL